MLSRLILRCVPGPTLTALAVVVAAALLVEGAFTALRAPVVPAPGPLLLATLSLLPSLVVLALPAALLVGTLAGLARLRQEGSWTALCAAGIPGRSLLPPLMLPASMAAAACLILAHGPAHQGQRLAARTVEAAVDGARLLPGRVVSLGDMALVQGDDGVLFLGSPDLAVAAGGGSAVDGRLTLGAGAFLSSAGVRGEFSSASIPLPATEGRRLGLDERSNAELRGLAAAREANGIDASYERAIIWKRTTLPLSCLLLPFLALPLGLGTPWGARHAILLVPFTWALVRLGDHGARAVGPAVASTLPLAGMALLAAIFWWRWRDR